MGIHNLDKIFRPSSIAVIGASEKAGSVGNALLQNLTQAGFKGQIYPVNPKHDRINGLKSHKSIKDIQAPVDLAVLITPIAAVPDLIRDCVRAGAGGAVILSAGGKETGAQGKALEQEILKEARANGLRIIGPNCLGIINSRLNLNATFASRTPLPGKMAFISQSGAICTAVLDISVNEHIGFSHVVSLGSMLDVDFGDMIDYLGSEYNVTSIVMYVESLTRMRYFMSAARSISMVKPIIVLKAGRSRAGAAAAASHTGALMGDDAVYDAAFKRAGIVRVKTFEELFDCAELLARQRPPSGPGLAVVTNAGGPGVMAADAMSDYGMEPVSLSSDTIAKLNAVLPPHWSRKNPVDVLGDATPELYRKAVEICMNAPEVNALLLMTAPQALTDPSDIAAATADFLKGKQFPVITSWIGGEDMKKGRDIFNQAGVPTFDTPERAVRAFMDLYKYSRNVELLQEIPPRLPGKLTFDREKAEKLVRESIGGKNFLLTEVESKDLLAAYGIPVNPTRIVASADEAAETARELGFPLAMKIYSRDITHKSDAGGIMLDLKDAAAVRGGFTTILENARRYQPDARIDGVTLAPMVNLPEYELILGAKKDQDFGPVILFGMGGIMTEVLKDRSIALPPLNRLLARRLMEETKVFTLLKGFRNQPPADLALLEEILIRLSQLVIDFPEIRELDINPLIITGDKALALDARVLLETVPAGQAARGHLVISPYPNEHETRATIADAGDIFIRPIRPEDGALFLELFESLSPQSVYYRFFSPLKQISPAMLARFTQIDYDREIALVAIRESGEREKMLGVSRVILERNQKNAEFSVLVGDEWQGKGIGALLLSRCLWIAKKRGIDRVYGIVLPENRHMLALGKKLGFKMKKDGYSGDYELEIDCKAVRLDA